MSNKYQFLNEDGLKTHFAGDEEMISELVEIFEDTYPTVLSELKSSIVENELEVMERSAHSLKGMVANFFSDSIKEDCFLIEKMGREQKIENINEIVLRIEKNIPVLLDEVRIYLAGEE